MTEHPSLCRTLLVCVTSCLITSGATVTPLATNEQQRSATTTHQQTNFILARGQVGQLKIGMTADEVVALFGNQRMKHVDLQLEGMPTPALEIRLGNVSAAKASLVAELFPPAENRVWRVSVFDRRFKTADGLGIGSTLGQIRARHKVRVGVGEGGVGASVEDLQMTFDFSQWYPSVHIPASARAKSVLVLLQPGELLK
jgi:hypothetical protein